MNQKVVENLNQQECGLLIVYLRKGDIRTEAATRFFMFLCHTQRWLQKEK